MVTKKRSGEGINVGTATIILLVNKTINMAMLLIPIEVAVPIPRATTCGKIATAILSTKNHKPAIIMAVVVIKNRARMKLTKLK